MHVKSYPTDTHAVLDGVARSRPARWRPCWQAACGPPAHRRKKQAQPSRKVCAAIHCASGRPSVFVTQSRWSCRRSMLSTLNLRSPPGRRRAARPRSSQDHHRRWIWSRILRSACSNQRRPRVLSTPFRRLIRRRSIRPSCCQTRYP